MKDGSTIKITISSYYTPNGRNIHGIGIEPDIICEFDGALYYDTENPIDNQFEKAKHVQDRGASAEITQRENSGRLKVISSLENRRQGGIPWICDGKMFGEVFGILREELVL